MIYRKIGIFLLLCHAAHLSAVSPSDVLPDNKEGSFMGDTYVRKGTIASVVANAHAINKGNLPEEKLNEIIKDIENVIPGLHALEFFQYFKPDEWLKESNRGRSLVAALYLKEYPEEANGAALEKLEKLKALETGPMEDLINNTLISINKRG